MSAKNLLYRAARSTLRRVPPWLLRFRPYTVFAIPTERFGDLNESGGSSIRWIESVSEVEPLYGSRVEENFAEWDGVAKRAAVAMVGNEPIVCVWVAAHSYLERELNLEYQLADDDRWVYAALAAPDHRGQGHYARLLNFVGAQLRAEGARRVLYGVVTGNQVSENAHRRWRPETVGRIFAVRSLGGTIYRCGGAVKPVARLPFAIRQSASLRIE